MRTLKLSSKILIWPSLLFLLLWPAVYNGQPLFSPDTSGYVRAFDAGVVWLSGKTTSWTSWASKLGPSQAQAQENAIAAPVNFQGPTFVIAGRSISYGGLLYLGEILGGMWASIVLQAGLALTALALTLRHLGMFSFPKLIATTLVLSFCSSLPFFTSFLLPDIFAPLLLLAAANLLALGDRLTRLEKTFWLSMVAAAVVFHPTHVMIVIALIFGAVITRLMSKKLSRVGIVALICATAFGLASEITFSLAVQKVLGVPASRPPVLMARMIASGSGASYLKEKCPEAGLAACEFVDRLTTNSDAFLWNTSAATGVYRPASVDKRRELGNEQIKFAWAVLTYDPIGQITASFRDAFEQLRMIGLEDFRGDAFLALPYLPADLARGLTRSSLAQQHFPLRIFSDVTIIVAILSLTFIFATSLSSWREISREYKVFCFVILTGMLANAFVCGALSGPHDRYQSRLMWLAPFLALVFCYERWGSRTSLVVNGAARLSSFVPLAKADIRGRGTEVVYLGAIGMATLGWVWLIASLVRQMV